MLMGFAVPTCHSRHMTVAEKYFQAIENRHQTPSVMSLLWSDSHSPSNTLARWTSV